MKFKDFDIEDLCTSCDFKIENFNGYNFCSLHNKKLKTQNNLTFKCYKCKKVNYLW